MANFSVEWLSKSFYEDEESALPSKEIEKSEAPRISSPNDSCGSTSGSESEVGEDSEEEAGQQRRLRTKFSSQQVSRLEDTFSRHRYLGAVQRRKTAEKLNLSETQVKTWFQNRRMKLKRETLDMRPAPLSLPADLLFQHHALSGQLPAGGAFFTQLQPLHSAPLPAALRQHCPIPVPRPPHFY